MSRTTKSPRPHRCSCTRCASRRTKYARKAPTAAEWDAPDFVDWCDGSCDWCMSGVVEPDPLPPAQPLRAPLAAVLTREEMRALLREGDTVRRDIETRFGRMAVWLEQASRRLTSADEVLSRVRAELDSEDV